MSDQLSKLQRAEDVSGIVTSFEYGIFAEEAFEAETKVVQFLGQLWRSGHKGINYIYKLHKQNFYQTKIFHPINIL